MKYTRRTMMIVAIILLTLLGWSTIDLLTVQNPVFTKATYHKNEPAPFVALAGEAKPSEDFKYRVGIRPEWYKPSQLVRYAFTGKSATYKYLPVPDNHYIKWGQFKCDGILPDNITIQRAIDSLPETGNQTITIYPNTTTLQEEMNGQK